MASEAPSTTSFVQEDLYPALAGLIEPGSIDRDVNGAIRIHGRLLMDAAQAYRPLRARFERLGYTPFLRSHRDGVEVLALPGVLQRHRSRPWVNIVLFALTLASVLITGAFYEYPGSATGYTATLLDIISDPSYLARGFPFAGTLIGILFAHEMGHYVVGRIRHAPASLPYFIPLPPAITITGTLGAVIVQREPFEDRRTLLEVAIAGPLAGLVVAIPLLFYGLSTSPLAAIPASPTQTYVQEGNSLFYALVKHLVFGQWLPGNGLDVQLNTIAWGAWIGLLVTMLNLLPVGQLDGGHIAYALLGERATWLAYAVIVGILGFAILFPGWLIWLVLVALMGARHPPPFNDVTPLKPVHVALGVIGLLLFVLLFMPQPIAIVGM